MENLQVIPHNGDRPKLRDDIRIVCISDTHNQESSIKIPEGDILIHCGDFCKIGTSSEVQQFRQFLRRQNFQFKIVIAGNHDYPFDIRAYPAIMRRKGLRDPVDPFVTKASFITNFVYLEDSGIDLLGYSF